ncbi:methyltransferase domain-containing protein [Aeromicrobium panaciterrae]|uniref:class I SAM-dependent methyltransferase n=1 Tax=Aeromicrobium panaciterrae TaxID=363861 RepID=UPI0031E496A0
MTSNDRNWGVAAYRLGRETTAAEPTRWLERLWSSAEQDEIDAPWDRTEPFPVIAEVLAELGPGDGRRAVVVGAALGADAEAAARAGWRTSAFDVAPAAVRLVRARYPQSPVDYREGNLLDLAGDLIGAFDLVIEVFTVQAMPPAVRAEATAGIRRLLAPGGTALVIQVERGDQDPAIGPPWLLNREEMETFADDDVRLESLDLLKRPRVDRDTPIWFARLRRD